MRAAKVRFDKYDKKPIYLLYIPIFLEYNLLTNVGFAY